MNQKKYKLVGFNLSIIIFSMTFLLLPEKACAGIKINLNGISAGAAFGGPPSHKAQEPVDVNIFHVKPQIIYRLDDHRYVELSYYESCVSTIADRRTAEAYYYDTKLGIKTQISSNIRNFIGQIINADPTGKNIVFAGAPDEFFSSNTGNGPLWATYSTDYGRTFSSFRFGNGYSFTPIRDSEDFTVVITEKELAAYDETGHRGYWVDFFYFDQVNDKGKFTRLYERRYSLPQNIYLMDRYQCDNSIKAELEVMPIDEFKEKYRNENE